MTVADLAGYVKQYWPTLKARLLAGEYHPQAVRAVEIPKPQGGTRQLGIPTVVDRLIQQALQQQLTLIFDPLFRTTATVFVRAKALTKPLNGPLPCGGGASLVRGT
jgi:retron-type reverse transcriptase